MKNTLLLIGLVIILIIIVSQIPYHKTPTQLSPALVSTQSAALGTQTKTQGCQIQGPFPDKACTPGAIIPSATSDEVCQRGYSKSVRNVPNSEKDHVYQEYEVLSHSPGQYEVDHFISLELGGSNDISNLWPEAADPKPGFHEKDKVENYLHEQVCNGTIALDAAQKEIAGNWLNVYNSLPK